jgi:hypothetical protein
MAGAMYDNNSAMFNGPKTSVPRYQAGQQQSFGQMMGYPQHFTPDQVLAPPKLLIDEQIQEESDPSLQAQLFAAKHYLSLQQQQLQQQLANLQAAALNLNAQYPMIQQQPQQQVFTNMYQQQVNQQPMMVSANSQPDIYTVYDPVTGQQTVYVNQSQPQLNTQFTNQNQYSNGYPNVHQGQSTVATPRVQVSPPPLETNKASFRNPSPPRRYDSHSPIDNPAPLPPPSANAFRRGHKKSNSLVNNANKGGLSINVEEQLKTAGPKTATFPMTPLTATGSYGPGQARAGEHPVRQPRNPPSMDELKAKPTAKHEGSKNFVTRTRRSAIHNLVRAGLERRKEARSSGSISPISEGVEEPELVETPMTDDTGSDSGHSGSGSLVDADDAECSLPSSRTSTGSWGAIGSDRPSSRQKVDRNSLDGASSSDNESGQEPGSFASLLKNVNRASKAENSDGQRKAPMLVLTSAEKRKVAA